MDYAPEGYRKLFFFFFNYNLLKKYIILVFAKEYSPKQYILRIAHEGI